MLILLWLVPPVVVAALAMAWAGWAGRTRPALHDRSEAAQERARQRFAEAIEREMRTAEGTTVWYLRVIHYMAQDSDVWTLDISGEEWGEVDFPEDVASAEELVAGWA